MLSNLGTRWRYVVGFMLQPHGESLYYPLNSKIIHGNPKIAMLKLTIYLQLVPRLRNCGAIPLLPYIYSWHSAYLSTRNTLLLAF